MQFQLTGVNQGKTLRVGGFLFEDGSCEVPENNQDGLAAARNLLGNFYEAYPASELEMAGGKLVKRAPVPEEESGESEQEVTSEENGEQDSIEKKDLTSPRKSKRK